MALKLCQNSLDIFRALLGTSRSSVDTEILATKALINNKVNKVKGPPTAQNTKGIIGICALRPNLLCSNSFCVLTFSVLRRVLRGHKMLPH